MGYRFEEGWRGDGRRPVLWIAHNGKLYRFNGMNIDGVARIQSAQAIKVANVRTRVVYYLELASGAQPCAMLAFPSKRLWPEDSVKEAFSRFKKQYGIAGVTARTFEMVLRRDFPHAHIRMTAGEDIPTELDWERSNSLAK